MNIRLAFFLFVFLLGLLFSCSCGSPFPKEHLHFVNGQVNLVTQFSSIQQREAYSLVNILWDSQDNLIMAGNFPKDAQNKICASNSHPQIEITSSLRCSFIIKFRQGKMEWIFIHPYYLFDTVIEKNNQIIASSEKYLFKLSIDGQMIWEKIFNNIEIYRIILDQNNNIIVSGNYTNSSNLGDYIFPTNRGFCFFIKFNPDGNLLWAETDSNKFPIPRKGAIAIDNEDSIAIFSKNDTPFFGKKITPYYSSNSNFTITKLDKNKNHIWITSVDDFVNKSRTTRWFSDIELIDRHIPMYFNQTGDLFLGLRTDYGSWLIIKINKEGTPLWSNTINSPSFAWIHKIKSDRYGNVYTVGSIQNDTSTSQKIHPEHIDPIFFGKAAITPKQRISPFIAKLSVQGDFVWIYIFDVNLLSSANNIGSQESNLSVFDIKSDPSNTMAFAGIFVGSAIFPTESPSSVKGFHDIFVFTADLEPKVVAPPQ